MTLAWHKVDTESEQAYAAFLAYAELGERRSLAAANARVTKPGSSARGPGRCAKWSKDHDWVERAAAFDTHEIMARIDARQEVLDRARQIFIDSAVSAAERLVRIATGFEGVDPDTAAGRVQLAAIKDVLDRAGLATPRETKVNLGASGPATITVKIGGEK